MPKRTNMAKKVMTTVKITDILAKPYARMVIPDPDGGFTAEIVEFSGCIAMGESAAEALDGLEEVAADWIGAAIEQGQDIPEPMDAVGYSGKLVLRMPKSLHQRASLYAERDGVSLNQFIVTCLAESVGLRSHPSTLSVQSLQTIYAPLLVASVAVVGPAQHPSTLREASTGPMTIVTTNIERALVNA
jgi:predicted RNase H-like HicB family nuclease